MEIIVKKSYCELSHTENICMTLVFISSYIYGPTITISTFAVEVLSFFSYLRVIDVC